MWSATMRRIALRNLSRVKRSALARQSAAEMAGDSASNRSTASMMDEGDCSSKNSPVGAASGGARTMSRAPPLPKATTGVPQACASAMAKPKSSSAAKTKARTVRVASTSSGCDTRPRNSMLGAPAAASATRFSSGPSPSTRRRREGKARKVSTTRSARL